MGVLVNPGSYRGYSLSSMMFGKQGPASVYPAGSPAPARETYLLAPSSINRAARVTCHESVRINRFLIKSRS